MTNVSIQDIETMEDNYASTFRTILEEDTKTVLFSEQVKHLRKFQISRVNI